MSKLLIAACLVTLYTAYSLLVYTVGTDASRENFSAKEQKIITAGKQLYQQHNCQSCHQLYGLGGYLGPDLTTAYSDRRRGEAYMKAVLHTGGGRMPRFDFTTKEIDELITYLKYVDSTATSLKTTNRFKSF